MEQYSDPDLTHLFVKDSEMTILVITDIQKKNPGRIVQTKTCENWIK